MIPIWRSIWMSVVGTVIVELVSQQTVGHAHDKSGPFLH